MRPEDHQQPGPQRPGKCSRCHWRNLKPSHQQHPRIPRSAPNPDGPRCGTVNTPIVITRGAQIVQLGEAFLPQSQGAVGVRIGGSACSYQALSAPLAIPSTAGQAGPGRMSMHRQRWASTPSSAAVGLERQAVSAWFVSLRGLHVSAGLVSQLVYYLRGGSSQRLARASRRPHRSWRPRLPG